MAVNLNTIFQDVSKNAAPEGNEDSVRSIVNSPLASGVPVGVGTSLITGDAQAQTTRIFAGGDASRSITSQSDRAQLPPSTTNKVPRVYGNVTTGGVVTDVHKSTSNTVFVAFTLSEMNITGYDQRIQNVVNEVPAFTLTEVYRNDSRCSFVGTESKVAKLENIDDPNTNVDIRAANVINVYAWAGNTANTSQIFPVTNSNPSFTRHAYDVFPTWDANVSMDNLVFAIVEVDRLNEDIDPTANIEIEEVGEFRFEIESTGFFEDKVSPELDVDEPLNNPAWALRDYLLDDVYGCGLTNADIDLNSISDWADFCDETIVYVAESPTSSIAFTNADNPQIPVGATYYAHTANRRQLNAFINPQDPVVDNIQKITQAGSATLSYDTKQGKFRVLVNRPATDSEKANAFVFDKDNITSSVAVNSTDLYSLYNFNEVTFPNNLQQDRGDNLLVETPTEDRVTNEPTSGTNFSIPAVSDRFRTADIANISLKQSRITNTISFTADHSTMGVAIGDFVKITVENKGFDGQIARVMRVNEVEQADGSLVFDYVCVA